MSLAVVRDTSPSRHRPRDVLQVIQNLRRQNPRAGESRLAELLADELLDDRALLFDAAGHLVRKALVTAKPKSIAKVTAARRQRVARQKVEREAVKAIAAAGKDLVALDMMGTLLDGSQKPLRFCTGRELGALGAAYGRIAAQLGADEMVGERFVEKDLRLLIVAA
jgi:hypothetical protein